MDSNTTEQDDLLAKINGLTSGMSMESQPAMPSMQASVPPVAPTIPSYEQPAMSQSFSPSAMPAPEAPVVPEASAMNASPMPSMQASMSEQIIDNGMMNAQPTMGMPQAPSTQDSFAASLGAVPVTENTQPQAPQQQAMPTMESRIPVPDNKIPTFDKPTKKKSNGAFAFIVVLLIIAIIGAGVFALYTNGVFDKFLNGKILFGLGNKDTSVQQSFDQTDPFGTDNVNPIDDQVITPVVKDPEFVDNTVTNGVTDKVIKAEYKVEGLEYDSNYIQMPYLNINSDDAKAINEDIQKRYKDYAIISADYKTENEVGINGGDANFKQRYLLVYYQAITQGDVISLLINELKYDGVDPVWNHYTYCVSSSTGKKLELTDLQTILVVDNNAMNAAYETYVPTLISSLTASESKLVFEHKINAFKSLLDYYNHVNSGDGIYYYVDSMGRINIITKLYIGDRNEYKVIAYSPASGCVVKDFKINDAKSAVGYVPMTSVNNNSENNGEAVNITASSNFQVSAKSLSALNDGDLIYGEDIKKIYRAYEYLLGSKGEELTLQYKNDNGSKSYSKGEYEILDSDIVDTVVYKLSIIKYASGSYRIIKFEKANR